MSDAKAAAAPLTVLLLTASFALAGPVFALAPRGMWVLVVAMAVLATVADRIQTGRWPQPPGIAVRLSVLFLVWCAMSLAWDLNPAEGARKLVAIAAIFAAGLALIGITNRLNDPQQRWLSGALVIGAAVGLILLSIETIFDFPIYRAVMGDSDPKLIGLLESKRSVDALPLLVWPAALGLARLGRPWLGALLATIFTVASFKLTASTAMLAMLAALATLALAAWSVTSARRLLTAATMLTMILIVPLAIAAYDAGGTTSSLKISARHRIEIWHFAAEKTLDRPLFGHGLDSSRFVPNGEQVSAFLPPDKPIMPLHPHDAFLQIWLELGLVGVAIVGALLIAALRAIASWPAATARFALPAYAAAMIVAGLAFGIWQTWWLATLAFGAVACTAVARQVDHG